MGGQLRYKSEPFKLAHRSPLPLSLLGATKPIAQKPFVHGWQKARNNKVSMWPTEYSHFFQLFFIKKTG
jgi:hypothetical protein